MMLRPGDPLWQKLRDAANAPRAQLPRGIRFELTDAGRAALHEPEAASEASDAHERDADDDAWRRG